MKPWWERFPGLLEYELDCLSRYGIEYEQSHEALAQGFIILNLRPEFDGEVIRLQARFPDFYPYLRFDVYAPDLNLPHHQNLNQKNLCLLGRDTYNWVPSDTLADFIKNRIPQVLKAGSADSRQAIEDIEERQAEPVSDYYPYTS